MRLRIIRDFSTLKEVFHAGEVQDIDPTTAADWLRKGLVMEDKSQDGAKETKVRR